MRDLSQRTRLVILVIYVLLLIGASRLALGIWLPPFTEKGLWFYSGLAAIILGSLLVSPYYTPPADAISNAVAAVIAIAAVNVWSPESYSDFDRFLWISVLVIIVLVLISSVFSIVLKDSSSLTWKRVAKSFSVFTSTVGTPRVVFSAVYLFALVTFHRDHVNEYLIIGISWAVLVALRPLETGANMLHRWREIFSGTERLEHLGEIVGHQIPGIVLIREEQEARASFADAVIVRGDDGAPGIALVLDQIGYSDGRWVRALHIHLDVVLNQICDEIARKSRLNESSALRLDLSEPRLSTIKTISESSKNRLLGIVAANSDLSLLRFEIIRLDLNLYEGRLIQTEIGGEEVLYQIVQGLTKEEIIHQKNTNGYVLAEAKKIGAWNIDDLRFESVKWVPAPNSPVYLVDEVTPVPTQSAVGHFPGTDFPVRIENISELVTHNTAILGILGVGKTFLALELIERMIKSGLKVICLDLTDQYANELEPYYDLAVGQQLIPRLQAIGPPGKANWQQNKEEGGSVSPFRTAVMNHLAQFLDPAYPDQLAIYNPSDFEVWRQTGGLYQGQAAMASLTPAEITRIITEVTLEVLQSQGMTDEARCCIVYEEAHSLIPEWSAAVAEGDKAASNGTTKAILQGRKYGLGCLVVTQRTANVTKSILNQCNSIFALRVFDATGMEFLRNYIGEDYSSVLSTLEDRHAVFFGRASSCREPVLIRLNDRNNFLSSYREPVQGNVNNDKLNNKNSNLIGDFGC